ncbi:hypothetical protein [Actinoallomurus iriomotensis]|uniref:Peptidase inhibitor family I36 n=1 Tax=Actinoallomurus iriomotensis TaxID=478107 RepID=A0A9W6RPF0_9ACTN|nr:hypothetical protein [Actinoallomurus iriomotensis]GLY77742.1 hypothetical protein Airi01_060090 [Actinoallomurus iriomotensis]
MPTMKRLAASGVVALAAAGTSVIAASPAHADYNRCPYGTVCLFTETWGNGTMWRVPHCGDNALPASVSMAVKSARTYGNSISFYYKDSAGSLWNTGAVNTWTSTNLGSESANKFNLVTVWC